MSQSRVTIQPGNFRVGLGGSGRETRSNLLTHLIILAEHDQEFSVKTLEKPGQIRALVTFLFFDLQNRLFD